MAESYVRLGLIGCGSIARRHLDDLAGNPRAGVVLFCDPQAASARTLRDRYAPHAQVETDFESAIGKLALDAVILCTPNALHYRQAKEAMTRGLHVLCEKPLAVSREQIVDLVECQRASRRVLSIAHQRRYASLYATARHQLISHSDFYGPVQQIHVFTCERWGQGIAGSWRDDPRQNAGYFGDAGIHQIDVVFFLSSRKAERLFAASDRRGARVEVATRVIAELTGGVGLFAHHVGDAHHFREDIHFHCRDADLLLRGDQLLRCRDNKVETISERLPNRSPASAFIDSILDEVPSITPPEIALPIFDWTVAVRRSLEVNQWIDV